MELLQEITLACRKAVGKFVEDRVDSEGRVTMNNVQMKSFARALGLGSEPWIAALQVHTAASNLGHFSLVSSVSFLAGLLALC